MHETDKQKLESIQKRLIEIIQRTTHTTALDHLTSSLGDIRKCFQCLDKGTEDFYRGIGES